jgi:hypothetical protein
LVGFTSIAAPSRSCWTESAEVLHGKFLRAKVEALARDPVITGSRSPCNHLVARTSSIFVAYALSNGSSKEKRQEYFCLCCLLFVNMLAARTATSWQDALEREEKMRAVNFRALDAFSLSTGAEIEDLKSKFLASISDMRDALLPPRLTTTFNHSGATLATSGTLIEDSTRVINDQQHNFAEVLHHPWDAFGANVDPFARGLTPCNSCPLHIAAGRGHLTVVQSFVGLLGSAADAGPSFLDPLNDHGATPLHWACSNGHAEVASFLVAHGSDPTIRTKRGATVWPLVECRESHSLLVKLISRLEMVESFVALHVCSRLIGQRQRDTMSWYGSSVKWLKNRAREVSLEG